MSYHRFKFIKFIIVFTWLSGLIPCYSGDYAASFLEIGVGGRALSMGGAFCSIADDGSAFYWNPAGLCITQKTRISGMYGQQFGTLQNPFGNFHYAGIMHPLTEGATVAFNWIRISIDDIPEYPELQGESYLDRLFNYSLRPTGEPIGYFKDVEDAFIFSFSKMLKQEFNMGWNYQNIRIDFPIGVNFKWIRQSLHSYKATGMGLDFGAMIRVHFSDLFMTDKYGVFSIGLNLQDFTTTHLKWNTRHDDNIPMNTKWGISYMQPLPFINHYLLMAFDWDSRWDGDRHFGFEYSAWNVLGIRIGQHGRNFTCGAGIRLWRIGFDYAFITHEFNYLHRISCDILL